MYGIGIFVLESSLGYNNCKCDCIWIEGYIKLIYVYLWCMKIVNMRFSYIYFIFLVYLYFYVYVK